MGSRLYRSAETLARRSDLTEVRCAHLASLTRCVDGASIRCYERIRSRAFPSPPMIPAASTALPILLEAVEHELALGASAAWTPLVVYLGNVCSAGGITWADVDLHCRRRVLRKCISVFCAVHGKLQSIVRAPAFRGHQITPGFYCVCSRSITAGLTPTTEPNSISPHCRWCEQPTCARVGIHCIWHNAARSVNRKRWRFVRWCVGL
jgi:hypothetical protein